MQAKLLLRVVVYWVACLAFVIVPLLLARVFTDPSKLFFEHFPELWRQYSQVVIPTFLVLPLLLLDMLRFSNQIAGPIYRLRREMDRLSDGEDVGELRFRDNDEWPELAESFNRLATEMRLARAASADISDDQCEPCEVV